MIIAGDVYDISNPSTEAIQLFDEFLVELVKRETRIDKQIVVTKEKSGGSKAEIII